MIDGDTVEVEQLGRVRLIGVDTPEERRCGETAATRFTRRRLEGKVVQYELGVEEKDRFDRTLAYLSREGRMHNLELVREGYARVLTIPPNDKYASRFEEAERRARARDDGVWGTCERRRLAARRTAVRERREREARRAALREAREARRAARRQARRNRAAARRRERQAEEPPSPDTRDGGGGGSCLPQSACPGRRDGDGDGCYCE